jgi:hypothetical protein
VTGAGADADGLPPPLCCDGALTTRSASGAGAACWTGVAGWAIGRGAVVLLAATNCECGASGTNVGKGARLIVSVEASACGAICDASSNVEDCAAGFASFPLSKAQPPSVAASEAAAMNIFTPGVPLDFELDLADGM